MYIQLGEVSSDKKTRIYTCLPNKYANSTSMLVETRLYTDYSYANGDCEQN